MKMLKYTVKTGETLGSIAAKLLGDASRYSEFMDWNTFITDPNRIEVGWVLSYPEEEAVSSNYASGTQSPVVEPPKGSLLDGLMNQTSLYLLLAAGVAGLALFLGKGGKLPAPMKGNPGKKHPNKRWKSGTDVQSVLVPKRLFTLQEARAWVKKHGFKTSKVDVTVGHYRFRQYSTKDYVRGHMRTIRFGKSGVKAVVGEVR